MIQIFVAAWINWKYSGHIIAAIWLMVFAEFEEWINGCDMANSYWQASVFRLFTKTMEIGFVYHSPWLHVHSVTGSTLSSQSLRAVAQP
jgi:hypothetical protein